MTMSDKMMLATHPQISAKHYKLLFSYLFTTDKHIHNDIWSSRIKLIFDVPKSQPNHCEVH